MSKSRFQTPKFNENSRFQERSVGERSVGERTQGKGNFSYAKPQNSKKQHRTFEDRKPQRLASVRETQLENASKTGSVKVVVKSSGLTPKVKKTGPLSPRAPEKIKKNRAEEMKVYGENACFALFEKRPESIVRAWSTVEMSHKPQTGKLFSYLAKNKKAYHVVNREELELVAGAEHCGGICLLVKKAPALNLQGYLDIKRDMDCVVLLAGVKNPQNIGAIIRSAAAFGVKAVVTEDENILQSASAMRIAEGGMEYIYPLKTPKIETALSAFREKGYQVVHSSLNRKASPLVKSQLGKKVVLVLTEDHNENFVQSQDTIINITPFSPVRSGLNVANTAAVLLANWMAKNQ